MYVNKIIVWYVIGDSLVAFVIFQQKWNELKYMLTIFHGTTMMMHWTQMADSHLGQSQMANGGLLRPLMSPGLKIPPWSTY